MWKWEEILNAHSHLWKKKQKLVWLRSNQISSNLYFWHQTPSYHSPKILRVFHLYLRSIRFSCVDTWFNCSHIFLPMSSLWHTGPWKKGQVLRIFTMRVSGKIVTLRLTRFKNRGQPHSPAILGCVLRITVLEGREREKEKRKAVWMITSPHCSMEPCPFNSFHHGQPRSRLREKGGRRGEEDEEGAVEDASCVAEWELAAQQRRRQLWWKKWWKMHFSSCRNKNIVYYLLRCYSSMNDSHVFIKFFWFVHKTDLFWIILV